MNLKFSQNNFFLFIKINIVEYRVDVFKLIIL